MTHHNPFQEPTMFKLINQAISQFGCGLAGIA